MAQQKAIAKATTTAVQAVAPSKHPLMVLGAKYNIEASRLAEVLRGTVIKPHHGTPATNEEIAAFAIVANQYDLNPFTREIYAFASGEKGVTAIVPIDGWTKIVNRHKNALGELDFDGCEFEEIEGEDGKPISITCTMHVKGREHPIVATERFSECKRNTGPWTQHPYRMLRHKAYMQAARYAFGLGGIHDEDEGRDIINVTESGSSTLREFIPEPKELPQPQQAARAPAETPKAPEAEAKPAATPDAPCTVTVKIVDTVKMDGPMVEGPKGGQIPEWTLYTGVAENKDKYVTLKRKFAEVLKAGRNGGIPVVITWQDGETASPLEGMREIVVASLKE